MLLRTIAFASAVLCVLLTASPGHANTYYVSTGGTSITCTASDPCQFIGQAITVAHSGDSIFCLSPPLPSSFTITKSVTIDCSTGRAPFRDTSQGGFDGKQVGFIINIPTSDALRTVRLRGLTIDGGSTNGRFLDRGIEIQAANAVYIEDCVISNVGFQGILDRRTGGQTKLFVTDSVISGSGSSGAGIVAASAAVGITVLDNVRSENNGYGIAVGSGNNVSIKNSVFSGNSVAGVEGDAGSHIMISNSAVTHNNVGIQSSSSVRFFSNDISFNNTAFSGVAATSGLNRYDGNVSMGTTPSAVPGAQADVGP